MVTEVLVISQKTFKQMPVTECNKAAYIKLIDCAHNCHANILLIDRQNSLASEKKNI